MKEKKIAKSTICIFLLLYIASCAPVTVTMRNTTAPVLVGPVKKIKAKPTVASDGNEYDFDHYSLAYYFIMGGNNASPVQERTEKIVSSNEFDGELLARLDTIKEHAEVKQINIGSYSLLNFLFFAWHKAWAGIEGKIVKKENIK